MPILLCCEYKYPFSSVLLLLKPSLFRPHLLVLGNVFQTTPKENIKTFSAQIEVEILFFLVHWALPEVLKKKIAAESGKMECWKRPSHSLQKSLFLGWKLGIELLSLRK